MRNPTQFKKHLPTHIIRLVIGAVVASTAFASKICAQEFNFRTVFADAEYYLEYADFREALPLYQQLYKHNPLNANTNYRLGQCYLNLAGLKHLAIPHLEMAQGNVTATYQQGSFREERAPLKTLLFLGDAYRVNGKLEAAIEAYTRYKNILSPREIHNLEYVTLQIASCQQAIERIEKPVCITMEQLSFKGLHNKYKFNPVVSFNGQTMVFTVQEKFYTAIYWVKKSDGEWGVPINITLDLALEGEVYTTALNADGTEIFLFVNDRGDGNIFSSKLKGATWSPALRLNSNINTRAWETHASISSDGKMLLFTSNRSGGFGGIDIYFSLLQENGEWGPARNLGDSINTPFNEESPFLSADSRTLYLSSQGHKSMGGYDIVFSSKNLDNQWAKPKSMGYPINTTDDDVFYFPFDSTSGLITLVPTNEPNIRKISRVTITQTAPSDTPRLAGSP